MQTRVQSDARVAPLEFRSEIPAGGFRGATRGRARPSGHRREPDGPSTIRRHRGRTWHRRTRPTRHARSLRGRCVLDRSATRRCVRSRARGRGGIRRRRMRAPGTIRALICESSDGRSPLTGGKVPAYTPSLATRRYADFVMIDRVHQVRVVSSRLPLQPRPGTGSACIRVHGDGRR